MIMGMNSYDLAAYGLFALGIVVLAWELALYPVRYPSVDDIKYEILTNLTGNETTQELIEAIDSGCQKVYYPDIDQCKRLLVFDMVVPTHNR